MVDKLSFVKSPRSLRCSFKIFPMLCPILIGPLFHQGFHTNVRLDFLSAHGHGTVRPVRPRLLFLFPSEIILIRISITFNLRNFTSHQLFFFFFFFPAKIRTLASYSSCSCCPPNHISTIKPMRQTKQ